MADKHERILAKIRAELSPEDKRMHDALIHYEFRKNEIICRMPKDLVMLNKIYSEVIEVLCKSSGVTSRISNPYASLDDLDDILVDINWVWKNWIAQGFVNMMVGDPGVGKSMITLDLTRYVLSGKPFPTEEEGEKAKSKVIWVDTEFSQQLLRIRSKKLLGKLRSNVHIPLIDNDLLAQVDMNNEDHKAMLINMIDALKPRLLVVDSLGGANHGGENKVEDISPLMKFFAELALDTNVAVLMTHHLNKGSQLESPEISLHRIRGSTAIPQYARSIVALERPSDNETRLRIIKSNLAKIPEPFSLKIELDSDGDVTRVDYGEYKAPPKKLTKQEWCATWVSKLLAENKDGLRLKEIIERAEPEGYTRSNIYAARLILKENVLVTGSGNVSYWKKAEANKDDIASIKQIKKVKRKGDINNE